MYVCLCALIRAQSSGHDAQDAISEALQQPDVDVNCRDAFQQTALILVREGEEEQRECIEA